MKLLTKNSIFIMIMILAFVFTGCTNTSVSQTENNKNTMNNDVEVADVFNDKNESSNESFNEDETEYPITISHAFGETILETKPERVATISWANQDIPLALGVIPVGISKANYGVIDDSGLLPWTSEKFKELGVENPVLFDDVAGLDFEAISDVQPDVILAAYSGITQEEYDLLSEIAPVIAYPTLPWQTYWKDQIIIDATGMGMKAEGEALVHELEELIVEKIDMYPQIKGKSAAFFYFIPSDLGKFYIYLPSDPRGAFLFDLEMIAPDSVMELAKESDGIALEISAENVDLLHDIDIIITYGDDTLLKALQADALVGTIPAIKRGSVSVIMDGTPLAASGTPSALSIPATIDEYLKLIGEAADKVK